MTFGVEINKNNAGKMDIFSRNRLGVAFGQHISKNVGSQQSSSLRERVSI
jgi:hypothetical protein